MRKPSLQALVTHSSAPRATALIRFMVGGVFLSEGIQKFIDSGSVGSGRFEKIGFPAPELLAPLVGLTEIIFGILVLLGLGTRIAVIPLLIIMAVAVVSTKIPILQNEGFWKMAHASRNDYCMILGSLFLFLVGAGRWSLDARIARHKNADSHERHHQDALDQP